MTVINPGTGGVIGGPPTPSIYELETQAAALIARSQMGIVPDSLSRPLTEIDAFTLWKYQSNANNPVISMLNRIRITLKYENEISGIWSKAFERLLDIIDEETKEALIRESRLPPELRSSSYGSLDRVLGWTASTLTWLSRISGPLTDDELAVTRTPDNLMLPALATQTAANQAEEVVNYARDFLNEVGHNHPYFDGLAQFTNEIEEAVNTLREN